MPWRGPRISDVFQRIVQYGLEDTRKKVGLYIWNLGFSN